MTDEYMVVLPLRVGSKGKRTIYDAHPDGDGGLPGRSLGRMDTPAMAAYVVAAVNKLAQLEEEIRSVRWFVVGDGGLLLTNWDADEGRMMAEVPLLRAILGDGDE